MICKGKYEVMDIIVNSNSSHSMVIDKYNETYLPGFENTKAHALALAD